MAEYLSPGVYVEEIDTGPKPIEGVGTATAVFIGFTEKAQVSEWIDGELATRNILNQAQLVTNWTQYAKHFGGFVDGAYLPLAVYGYFQNGGTRCYVISVKTMPKAQTALLNNAGQPQLIVRAKQAGLEGRRLRVKIDLPELPAGARSTGKAKSKEGAQEEAPAQEGLAPFSITVEREKISGGWQVQEVVHDVVLAETESKTAKVAFKDNKLPQWIELIIPQVDLPLTQLWPIAQQQSLNIDVAQLPAPTAADFEGETASRTGLAGLEALEDVTMVCVPDLMATLPGKAIELDKVKAVQAALVAHCEKMGDRVAILDAPPNMNPSQVREWRRNGGGFDTSYGAVYYPWIQVSDPATNRMIHVPPSGHIAGVWARNDTTRGVHKAPANEVVLGAVGLATTLTKGEQDVLNPIGVNCIRSLPGLGIRVWGARTMSSNAAWRYINVRRLFNFVEKSIELSTQWVVFEPNTPKLWARVTRDITAFLRQVWRSGALYGGSPSEAFFVKCDEELNPPEARDLGQLVIEIGLAPVKPAEFVIFRISQWTSGAAGGEGGGEAAG